MRALACPGAAWLAAGPALAGGKCDLDTPAGDQLVAAKTIQG